MGDKVEALLRQVLAELEADKIRTGRSREGRLLALQATHVETALALRLAGDKLP